MKFERTRLAWILCGIVAVETLYSVPRLSYELATARTGLQTDVFALVFCGATVILAFVARNRIASGLERLFGWLDPIPSSRWLLVCGAAGSLLRVLWVLRYPALLQSDYATYFGLAKQLVRAHSYGSAGAGYAYWPPGYPYFLAGFFLVFGTKVWVPVVANLVLYWATLFIAYKLTAHVADLLPAKVATVLLVVWPTYFTSVGLASKEMLVAMLLPASLLSYFLSVGTGGTRRTLGWTVLAGILLGAASLTQPSVILFPAVFLSFDWFRREISWRSFVRMTCLLFVAALVIFPWTLRNYHVLGVWVPVSTNGGDVFYRANNAKANGGYMMQGDTNLESLDEVTRGKVGFALGKQWIRENPRGFLLLALRKQVLFLGDDAQGVYETFKRGSKSGGALYAVWKGICNLYWWALWVLILVGLSKSWRQHPPQAPAIAALMLSFIYLYAMHSVFESGAKYHWPLMVFVAALAALPVFGDNVVQSGA